MSKSKELRELINKVKDDISVQIDTIVEWNLDNSDYLQELYRISKENGEEFNDLFQDYVNYIKLISFEELLGEFKNTK